MYPGINDWQPLSEEAQHDQLAYYDKMRQLCPVAHSESLHYSVLGHAETLQVLHDHQRFSNQAGRHLSVPNGMDPPRHSAFRQIIEPYFSHTAMHRFRPLCLRICKQLVAALPKGQEVEIIGDLAEPFALNIQCAFMGWPSQLQQPLREWLSANQQAILAQDRTKLAELANAFDGYIRQQLALRRQSGYQPAEYDTTWQLMQESVACEEGERRLTDEELVSIIRNWTVGELGTIAASVGIICHYLAANPDLQTSLRGQPQQLSDSIDEILRINPPLIANRRKTTEPVTLGGVDIPQGAQLTLLWASANRDEKCFGERNAYAPERNKADNLLYGAGVHCCPGAPLARMELIMLTEQLLSYSHYWRPGQKPAQKAIYPAGGFKKLTIQLD